MLFQQSFPPPIPPSVFLPARLPAYLSTYLLTSQFLVFSFQISFVVLLAPSLMILIYVLHMLLILSYVLQ